MTKKTTRSTPRSNKTPSNGRSPSGSEGSPSQLKAVRFIGHFLTWLDQYYRNSNSEIAESKLEELAKEAQDIQLERLTELEKQYKKNKVKRISRYL